MVKFPKLVEEFVKKEKRMIDIREDKQNNDEILAQIANEIRDGQAVAFVGSGCSIPLGYPSWEDLRKELVDLCRGEFPSRRKEFDGWMRQSILYALQKCKETLQITSYNSYLRTRFGPGESTLFSEEHEIICRLFRQILTSNYDLCLEHAFAKVHQGHADSFPHNNETRVANFIEIDIRGNKQVIFHAHGDYNDPPNCIVTFEDYQKHYARSDFRQMLLALFQARTVVFIGFGLTDGYLMSIPNELVQIFKGLQEKPHYAILPYPQDITPSSKRNELQLTHNVRAVFYAVNGEDHYTPRLALLQQLEKIVKT